MLNSLKTTALAAAFAIAAPIAAMAVPIVGDISLGGSVNLGTSDFSVGGNVDLNPVGGVQAVSGTFAETLTAFVDSATFSDIDFTVVNSVVWSAGIFTFTSTSFNNIVDNGTTKSFSAYGIVSAAGYEDTGGNLVFTTQCSAKTCDQGTVGFSTSTTTVPLPAGLLLMGTALAGLGLTRRKKA